MKGNIDLDSNGMPIAWVQKIKGVERRFPYVMGYCLDPKRNAELVRADFDFMFPHLQLKCKIVTIPDELWTELTEDFYPRWLEEKKKEPWIAKLDPDEQFKRFHSGFGGEAAMETLLGVRIIDRDESGRMAVGNSKLFAGADLAKSTGLDIGIKSSEAPNFPTPRRNVRRPQVICLRVGPREFYVGGYASMKTQRSYMKSCLVLNDNLRNKRLFNGQIEKAGFYGFQELISFRSVDDLHKIYHKYR